MQTHFICVYSVLCKNLGTETLRQDYCESGLREIKYLTPFLKSVGKDVVSVFLITLKQP